MNETDQAGTAEKKLEGIGGWLILAAIGLCVSPIKIGVGLVRDVLPAFSGGVWEKLTTPGSPAYDPLWAPLLIMEMVGNIIFILFPLAILFFFFTKKRSAPLLMIIFLLSNLAFVVADYVVAMRIPVVASMPDESTPVEIIRVAIACAIWVPYFLKSKRVRNTFVK